MKYFKTEEDQHYINRIESLTDSYATIIDSYIALKNASLHDEAEVSYLIADELRKKLLMSIDRIGHTVP